MRPGYKTLRPTPCDPLPPARLCLLKVPKPPQTAPQAGDQGFKHWSLFLSLTGPFSFKPQQHNHMHVRSYTTKICLCLAYFTNHHIFCIIHISTKSKFSFLFKIELHIYVYVYRYIYTYVHTHIFVGNIVQEWNHVRRTLSACEKSSRQEFGGHKFL